MTFDPAAAILRPFIATLQKIERGHLRFTGPDGRAYDCGVPGTQPSATLQVHDWRAILWAAERGDIGMGEAYIDGLWDSDCVEDLFRVFLLNLDVMESYAHGSWLNQLFFRVLNTIIRRNSQSNSVRNIRAHYDVSNAFYELWLDPSMTYSSALYTDGAETLEAAQQAKYARIVDKIRPAGKSVLEIGCGWGGFAEYAARAGLQHVGLTVSRAQFDYAKARLEKAGLESAAEIRFQDYRAVDGKFDSIVSIEMFEAVGERYWPDYFRAVYQRLRNGGKAVIQTITIRDDQFEGYRTRSDFIRHYTFPGGMLPSLRRFREEAERAGLQVGQVFTFGQDYARTLRTWIERFDAAREGILALGFDAATIRSWRFYLSICAAAFAVGRTDVAQVELIREA